MEQNNLEIKYGFGISCYLSCPTSKGQNEIQYGRQLINLKPDQMKYKIYWEITDPEKDDHFTAKTQLWDHVPKNTITNIVGYMSSTGISSVSTYQF